MSEKKEAVLPWIKGIFLKIGSNFVFKFLAKLGLRLAGPLGWIASFFIDKILKKIWELIVRVGLHTAEKIQTKKELKEYKEVINKGGASAEEIKKAGEDFLSN